MNGLTMAICFSSLFSLFSARIARYRRWEVISSSRKRSS